MKAYQKMRGNNGLENLLFPFEYMYVTQGEHNNGIRYAMDFSGWGENGKIKKCPMYAPCTCKVVFVGSNDNNPVVCWESVEKVNFIDGSIDYACISVGHDDNYKDYTIGQIVEQGQVFAHTGNTGLSTGDHTHMIVGKGKYEGYYHPTTEEGNTLKNQYHMYNAYGVNDTIIVRDGGYTWNSFLNEEKKLNIRQFSLYNCFRWWT